MSQETKKVWVTKYLFTRGLFEADVLSTSFPDIVKNNRLELRGDDWHETKEND